MKIYVGVTDREWYENLRKADCDELNFWKPGSGSFKALEPNDMFLFKLHAPDHFIVGGGFFVRFSILPTYLDWDSFGIKNGTKSLSELNARITKYRSRSGIRSDNPSIGCIILTEPFFFDREDWIPAPADWKNSIVQGKTYTLSDEIGNSLYQNVQQRLQSLSLRQAIPEPDRNRFSESMTRHRIGQGAFRVMVTDAYHRRCAITGEKTLPVLEAAHIRPYAEDGPHLTSNGILMKSDFHTLFDRGYITIDPDYHIVVSSRLHDDYGNGKDYYKYHGEKLLILPDEENQLPAAQFLNWHNRHVYLG